MAEVKLEECCLENKQSTPASSSSISEGSGSAILKSPGTCSPAPTSPAHRYYQLKSPLSSVIAVLYCLLKNWDQI